MGKNTESIKLRLKPGLQKMAMRTFQDQLKEIQEVCEPGLFRWDGQDWTFYTYAEHQAFENEEGLLDMSADLYAIAQAPTIEALLEKIKENG